MNLPKPSALVLLALATFSVGHAQDPAVLLSASRRDVSQVYSTKIFTAHDLLGTKGFDVDVRGFGGFTWSGGKLTGGIGLTHRMPLSREWFVDGGLYGQFVQGSAVDSGLYLGFGLRL